MAQTGICSEPNFTGFGISWFSWFSWVRSISELMSLHRDLASAVETNKVSKLTTLKTRECVPLPKHVLILSDSSVINLREFLSLHILGALFSACYGCHGSSRHPIACRLVAANHTRLWSDIGLCVPSYHRLTHAHVYQCNHVRTSGFGTVSGLTGQAGQTGVTLTLEGLSSFGLFRGRLHETASWVQV